MDNSETPLADVAGFLHSAVQRLAVHDGTPRERVRRALELVRMADDFWPRPPEVLPATLLVDLGDIRDWVAMDPSLEELSDRDVGYLAMAIVQASHTAAVLLALSAIEGAVAEVAAHRGRGIH